MIPLKNLGMYPILYMPGYSILSPPTQLNPGCLMGNQGRYMYNAPFFISKKNSVLWNPNLYILCYACDF